MGSRDPAEFLPHDIREMLKRKSSRDPGSQFHTKLHSLLSLSQGDQALENEIGIAWISNDEFKIHKQRLAATMGIKLNSLNVNLRSCQFTSRLRDRDGWTRWSRPGFSRYSNVCESGATPTVMDSDGMPRATHRTVISDKQRSIVPTFSRPFSLGAISNLENDRFMDEARRAWQELVPNRSPTVSVNASYLLDRAAKMFRFNSNQDEEQSEENARAVMGALLVSRKPEDTELSFADFARFLAMFGPKETVMLKILSLLSLGQSGDDVESRTWLNFDRHTPDEELGLPCARFSEPMPNCLVIRQRDGSVRSAYNNPLVQESGEYVIDDSGHTYSSWVDYFDKKPLEQMATLYY